MNSVDILNSVIDVQKERGNNYESSKGGAERSFAKVASIFNIYTDKDLTPAHIALILAILKDVRQFSQDRLHEDSIIDSVSYHSLKGELLHEQYKTTSDKDTILCNDE